MGHLAHFEWLTVCHMSGAESANLSSSVGPMGDMWHLLIRGKSNSGWIKWIRKSNERMLA